MTTRTNFLPKKPTNSILQEAPSKYYVDGFNLCKRMLEYRESHLYFFSHPDVPYTNNLAERALRKFKQKQKAAVTFRSKNSVSYICDCMSVIETARLQGLNIFDVSRSAFALT